MRRTWHILPIGRARWVVAALLAALLLPPGVSTVVTRSVDLHSATPQETAARDMYGSLPLAFETNEGQGDPAARFLAHGPGYSLALAPDALTLGLPAPLRFTFPGANPSPAMRAEEPLPGIVNYFVGDDPARWRTSIPTHARVRYTDLYPGLDLIIYGSDSGKWEYDVVVAPGADPAAFALSIGGATGMEIDTATGDLALETPAGKMHQRAPALYQEVSGERRTVAGGYAMREDGTVGFRVGEYDPALPLVIDPTLVYSTAFGGIGNDVGSAIAVDTNGNAWVTGTAPELFPVTNGSTFGGNLFDAFVTKLNATGTLVYSTYLGGGHSASGSGDNQGKAIVVDTNGNAYITGLTENAGFPVTNNSTYHGSTLNGYGDAFVTKLNGIGARVYSTYLGGSGGDVGNGIAVDTGGNAYVTGVTFSTDFPVTVGSRIGTTFVTKFDTNGGLVYSTQLGGSGGDIGQGIAVDGGGNAYVTGYTGSSDFPTTVGSPYGGGFSDAFVVKLNTAGVRVYSTYLGGSAEDRGNSIAVDTGGNAYVTGYTYSANFPITNGSSYHSNADAFVTKLSGSGVRTYSTYLGGSGDDKGNGIAVDASGSAFVAGNTASADFPVTNGSTFGGIDVFITKLDGGGARLYSTYLGGSGDDKGNGIAVDSGGNVYVAGSTDSTDFPITVTNGSGGDGTEQVFVTKLLVSPPPVPNPLPPPQPHPVPSGQPAALPQARPTVPVVSPPSPLPSRRP